MDNVLLVFGGMSYEHDISVVTASQIYNKTRLENVKLVPIYVSRNNEFFAYLGEKFDIKDFSISKFKGASKKFKEISFISGEKNTIFAKTKFGLKEYLKAENIIFACHGGSGENGKLVSLFESYNMIVSAGDFDSLAICMNKFLFKQVMKGLKIPVVKGFRINKFDYFNDKEIYKYKFKFLKFPLIIKSNNGGSSIGLFVAKTREDFEKCLKDAFEFDNELLIESYCENAREFNVAIVGDGSSYLVSEIDEPLKENEILTFADKYNSNSKGSKLKNGTKNSMASQSRKFPAEISEELKLKIKFFAQKIFKKLNLSGVVRIDFLYEEKYGKLYVCEVNAIPGSLAYYFFENNAITTNDLVLKLLEVCKRKRKMLKDFKIEFSTNILD